MLEPEAPAFDETHKGLTIRSYIALFIFSEGHIAKQPQGNRLAQAKDAIASADIFNDSQEDSSS